jgi:hypothetical protein
MCSCGCAPIRVPGQPYGEPQITLGDAPAIIIGTVVQGSEQSAPEVRFRVRVPDSRLMVKVSVFFVVANGANEALPITSHNATLYLGEEEHDRSGSQGSDRLCTDILRDSSGTVIHQSDPLAIPEDVGLAGFSQEFRTSADSILGIFQQGAVGGPGGTWILQCRWQPDGLSMPPAEWEYVKRGCNASLITPAFNLV